MEAHDDEIKAKVPGGPIVSFFCFLMFVGLIAFIISIFTGPAAFRIGSIAIAVVSFFIMGFAGLANQKQVSQKGRKPEKVQTAMDLKKNDVIQTAESVKDRQIRVDALERLITDCQKPYYEGEIGISDTEFDKLRDEFKALCPESPVLARIEKDTKIDETPIEDLAYQAVVNQRKPENALFHIEYVDFAGNKTSRDIKINRFDVEEDRFYIYAYCYLREETRQFLVDRIASISCEGRTIQNPKQFLWDMYINSPLYKTQQAVNEHADEIRALVFLSRADGRMLKNEREIIVRYIDLVAPGIDAESVEKTLKNTACDLAEFNKILKRAKSWGPDIKKLVMDAASQLFALKKQPDPMEQGAFEKLKAIIR
jgi:hypothetical protein